MQLLHMHPHNDYSFGYLLAVAASKQPNDWGTTCTNSIPLISYCHGNTANTTHNVRYQLPSYTYVDVGRFNSASTKMLHGDPVEHLELPMGLRPEKKLQSHSNGT